MGKRGQRKFTRPNQWKSIRNGILLAIIALMGLAGCKATKELTQTPTEQSGQTTPELNPSLIAETVPPETLTICMAEEPQSLYLYDGRQSGVKLNVLQAIYDGPIDREDFQLVPVILDNIPTLGNCGLTLEPVVVIPGQTVIDADGELRAFRKGVNVRPSGCQQSDCAVTWDGSGEFKMDVMMMNFTLVEGLKWSDGIALKASDSVYSFQVASDKATPGSRWAIDRTAAYQALDQKTVVWKGLPGFLTTDVDLFFWSPLPEHAWSDLTPMQLLEDDRSNQTPLGWGAYKLEEWNAGEQIELSANPYYFRAGEGLPYFDKLTYKFISDRDMALSALEQGECDILDGSYHLEGRLSEILTADADQLFNAHIAITPVWEGLIFGINPASYEDGYTPIYGDRLDYFGDPRTRQAFAYCVDRQRIVDETLLGLSRVPQGLSPSMEMPIDSQPLAYLHDESLGNQLLEQVGWKDVDLNPETPREAWGINGIPSGTPFEITLLNSPSIFQNTAAQIIKDSLTECGVQVTLETLTPQDLFAPGPDGPLFGRQ
ncbi:MAG: ABC transporter substrate-binding protein, partial [Anaerolineaceae bacterium]|nr:ABC transporter substrate-binding protein [Anaerolineaceae bacterium]